MMDQGQGVILLAAYNGARYLPDQLDSLAAQTRQDWVLYAGDDGSQDDTRACLRDTTRDWTGVRFSDGPQMGPAAHFLDLLARVPPGTPYAAFCDQDDVWHPEKLDRACAALAKVPRRVPALYCAGSLVTDADLGQARASPPISRPPSFGNALVENIAQGATIVLNRAALAVLVPRAGRAAPFAAFHDWWCYLALTGVGGQVIYDPWPALQYRQHAGNVEGYGGAAAWVRPWQVLAGGYRQRIDDNLTALDASRLPLTQDAVQILARFRALRAARSPLARVVALRGSALTRQSVRARMSLMGACALGVV